MDVVVCVCPEEVHQVARFVASRYVETDLLSEANALSVVFGQLNACKQVIYVRRDQILAACGVLHHDQEAEITCLASISPLAVRRVFMEVGRLVFEDGLKVLTAEVHPKYAEFYRDFIGAQTDGEVHEVPFVGGAPGVRIRLELTAQLWELPGWRRYLPRSKDQP